MLKKHRNKIFCFSPPVMLATFMIEFSFAIYTYLRYKASTIKRLAIAMLVALGTFQLAEYMICGGLGWTSVEWARVGYVAITLLPALGIHMVVSIAGKKMPLLVKTAYVTCAAFAGFYLIGQNAFNGQTCYANYAIFHTHPMTGWPFAAYYYGWLFIGTYLSIKWSKELPNRKNTLMAMALGYMAFILPTTAFNIIDTSTVKAIPSIMCGFAVIFAFVLVAKVLPNSCRLNSTFDELRSKLRIRV